MLEHTGDFSQISPHKWSLKKKRRRRDVNYQHLNICNLYMNGTEVYNNIKNNNNNNNNNNNVCIMQFSNL